MKKILIMFLCSFALFLFACDQKQKTKIIQNENYNNKNVANEVNSADSESNNTLKDDLTATLSDVNSEITPVEETRVEVTLVEETPVEETPVEETPVEETPVEETPVEETPVQETPIEETPVEETPVEETPVEETPVEETPVEETPVEETPVEETPVEETPVEETPVEETPVEETPVEETPVEETPKLVIYTYSDIASIKIISKSSKWIMNDPTLLLDLKNNMCYRGYTRSKGSGTEFAVQWFSTLGADRIDDFIQKLPSTDLFNIDLFYVNHGIYDGCGWQIIFTFNDGMVRSVLGYMDYPKDIFEALAPLIHELCDSDIISDIMKYNGVPKF